MPLVSVLSFRFEKKVGRFQGLLRLGMVCLVIDVMVSSYPELMFTTITFCVHILRFQSGLREQVIPVSYQLGKLVERKARTRGMAMRVRWETENIIHCFVSLYHKL